MSQTTAHRKTLPLADEPLWIEAYRRYIRFWTNLARTTLITREEAEDIVHGVVSSLLLKQTKRFESVEHIRNYVAKSVVNRAIQLRQRGGRHVDLPDSADPASLELSRSGTTEHVSSEVLRSIIQQLPGRDFEIIKLRFYSGFTFKEIGELLNLPISTLKSREDAALKRIRRQLRKRGSSVV
jgi:RNA polymerase sigma-70 factor, ECF subfamily